MTNLIPSEHQSSLKLNSLKKINKSTDVYLGKLGILIEGLSESKISQIFNNECHLY